MRELAGKRVVMDMTLTHPEVGTPLDTSNAVGLFKFESEVSDDLTVGGTLTTSGALIKSIYAFFDFGNGFKANWKMDADEIEGEGSRLVPSVEIDADARYQLHLRGDGTSTFSINHSKRGWSFSPSLNLRTRTAGLKASAELDKDTHMKVHVTSDASISSFEVNHDLDKKTSVKVH